METKDFIIIGGAIALFYLYQKNKNKTSTTSTVEVKDEATPMPVTPKPLTITPVTPRPVTITPVNGGTTSGGDAIFTGNTPVNTISPVVNPTPVIPNLLTPNPEIIVGGTRPVPALVPTPVQTTEEALISGGVRPVVRPTRGLSASIY